MNYKLRSLGSYDEIYLIELTLVKNRLSELIEERKAVSKMVQTVRSKRISMSVSIQTMDDLKKK